MCLIYKVSEARASTSRLVLVIPRPIERAKVGSAGEVLRRWSWSYAMIPRAAPVSMIDGTGFLELAAMLLPLRFLRLHHVHLDGLRSSGAVGFLRGPKKSQYYNY